MIAEEFGRSTNKVIEVEEVSPLENRMVSYEQRLVICTDGITLKPSAAEQSQEIEPA